MVACVLIVDDNRLIREQIRALLKSEPDLEVCGEAEHGRQAIERAKALMPHLVILDLQMPVMNGLQAAPVIRKHLPHVRLILFTLYAGDAIETAARAAGIHAVVAKDKAHLLVPTVRSLLRTSRPNGHTATA